MLEQFLKVVGHRRKEHGFVRPGFAPGVDSAQAVVVNQAAEHGLNGALPSSPHGLAAAALLPFVT